MEALLSGLGAFAFFHFASHPKSKIHKKLPSKSIKRVQLIPSLNFEVKNKIFHFHHWMLFTPTFVFVNYIDKGLIHSDLLNGALIGGIVQGLLYKDRFKLVHKAAEYQKTKSSTYNISFLKKLNPRRK